MISSCAAWLSACVSAEQTPDEQDGDETETSATTGEFASLIDHEVWIPVEAEDDPLAEHRPAEVTCTAAGWFLENEILEIDTNFCNYLALGQPSLAEVIEGRLIRLEFYHFNLVAPEPAIAHVALVIDGAPIWEQEIAIPGDAWVYEHEFAAPISAPAGSALVFHLHNHGQNTWALMSISAQQ